MLCKLLGAKFSFTLKMKAKRFFGTLTTLEESIRVRTENYRLNFPKILPYKNVRMILWQRQTYAIRPTYLTFYF